jgi:hypothetical protein
MQLYVDKNLDLDQKKERILGDFCVYCAKYLPIEGSFKICVVSQREPYGIGTTAVYHVNQNKCFIYGKNRALPDIMRSIAHEMTHMMQDQTGLLVGNIRDAGGFHEDQANARAGELIKRFVKGRKDRDTIYESKL